MRSRTSVVGQFVSELLAQRVEFGIDYVVFVDGAMGGEQFGEQSLSGDAEFVCFLVQPPVYRLRELC
ncbi:hypothetical protein [Haladaptatus sp. NG-WS-4]